MFHFDDASLKQPLIITLFFPWAMVPSRHASASIWSEHFLRFLQYISHGSFDHTPLACTYLICHSGHHGPCIHRFCFFRFFLRWFWFPISIFAFTPCRATISMSRLIKFCYRVFNRDFWCSWSHFLSFTQFFKFDDEWDLLILFSIDDKYQLCLICSFLFYHLTKILQIENFLYIHNASQASDDCRLRSPGVNRSNQLLNRQYFNLFIGEMGLCTQEKIHH